MKPKIMRTCILCLLPLFVPIFSFAQEIYQDTKGSEFLFIGSLSDTSIKVWNLNEKTVEWKPTKQLEQTGRLSSTAFLQKVFDEGLVFSVDAYEPFWGAEIRRDSLIFLHPEFGKEFYKIKIDINDFLDSSFSFMFSSEDKEINGLVRQYTYYPENQYICNFCLCEETPLIEIFVNYKGYIYHGCALIIKKEYEQ